MFIPIWLIATLIYVFALCATVLRAEKQTTAFDFATPFIALVLVAAETIAYLIFWIIYLAV